LKEVPAMPRKWLLTASVLTLLLMLTSCSAAPKSEPSLRPPAACTRLQGQDSAVVAWLTKQAVHLRSVEPGASLKDLTPLKEDLKDVRLIGLGEATHGTREFSTAKHRFMQFLVQGMGVHTLLWEANYGGMRYVNDYIHGGPGDARSSMQHGVFLVWQTEEVAAMLDWMRSYNQSAPPDKQIQVIGIDAQDATLPAEELERYLQKVAPTFYPSVSEPLEVVRTTTDTSNTMPFSTKTMQRLADLQGIGTYLTEHKPQLVAVSSPQEFDRALLEAHVVARYFELEFASLKSDIPSLRDKLMADTAVEVLGQVGTAALWAHNSHITTDVGFMGRYLRNKLGDKYYAIDLLTYQGKVTAAELKADGTSGPMATYDLKPAAAGQLEWYFACAGLGNSYVNVRDSAIPSDVAAWLDKSQATFAIGWAWPTRNQFGLTSRVWPDSLDGLLYIPVTTASRPLH
jgi:erythromycin esterase